MQEFLTGGGSVYQYQYTAYDLDPVSIKGIAFGMLTPLPISKISKSWRCLKHWIHIFLWLQ